MKNPICPLLVIMLATLRGCATPVRYSDEPLQSYDKNTEYRTDDFDGGFQITVSYSRYQFIPESDAVAIAGKSALTSIAYEVAQAQGKEIEPINEQTIKMSMGRNGLTGITSWSGMTKVFFKEAPNSPD